MIKNPGKYLEISEKEREEYLRKLTYKESAAMTEALMSSKMLLEMKPKNIMHHPRALCLTLRKGPFGKPNT